MVELFPVDGAMAVGAAALCMLLPLGGVAVRGSGLTVSAVGVLTALCRGGSGGGRGDDGLLSSCCSSSMFRDLCNQQPRS